MSTRIQAGPSPEAGVELSDPRSLLRLEVAKLTEAECREVNEYIEIMRALGREVASRGLFGDGFARRVSAVWGGAWRVATSPPADTQHAHT